MKKRLSGLILALILVFNLFGTVSVGAKAVSELAEVPLSYLDNDSEWSIRDGDIPFPNPFVSLDLANASGQISSETRYAGGDASDTISAAKASDDSYFKIQALADGLGGEANLNIVASSTRYLLTTEVADVITASFDFATSYAGEKTSAAKYLFSTGTHASRESGKSNTWKNNVTIEGNGDIAIEDTVVANVEANKWYNITMEIGSTTGETAYKVYLNGVEIGSGALPGKFLAYLRAGINSTANAADDLYIDNYSLTTGEPYTAERYKVNKDAAALSFARHMASGTDTKAAVTANLTLPASIPDGEGSTITWASDNEAVINAATGAVTRQFTDTNVKLTATVTNGDKTAVKEFDLVVTAKPSDVRDDADALDFDDIKGANTAETKITSNLTLPAKGESGATDIEWASDNADMIGTDGTVIRDALANAQDVKLTATVKGTGEEEGVTQVKEFNLRVCSDVYMLDDAVDTTKPYYKTAEVNIKTEGTYKITGWGHSANGKTGQYLVYNAAEGSSFSVKTVVSTVNLADKRTTFEVSADNVTYTPFTAVAEADSVLSTGTFGGYAIKTYTSTEALPAGTKYLKVVIPDTSRAWHQFIDEIKIVDDCDEITFEDIKGANSAADVITDALVLPAEYNGSTIQWSSSDPAVIAADGTVTRPETDTDVKLTAVITEGEAVSTKYYDLTVKAYTEELTVVQPWVFRENAEGILVPLAKDTDAHAAGNKLVSKFTVTNLTGSDKEVYAILAVYSADDELLDLTYEKITVTGAAREEEKTVELVLADETEDVYVGSTIKAFVWNPGSYDPLTLAASYVRTI